MLSKYLRLMRVRQYIKNLFIFLPVFFAGKMFELDALLPVIWSFVAFSLVASSVYVLNDIRDIDADRVHPVKKFRPLAAGDIGFRQAIIVLVILLVSGFTVAWLSVGLELLVILTLYVFLNIAYSIWLKHVAIVDLICISLGFLLRIFCGGMAAEVILSHWIVLMTFLLSLFLGLAKRRDDLVILGHSKRASDLMGGADGRKMRRAIDGYNLEFVSTSMAIMASVIIMGYIMYTLQYFSLPGVEASYMYLTVIWVIMGLLRYMQIAFVEEKSGSPTEVLYRDVFLKLVVLAWILNFVYGIYLHV